MSNAAAEIYEFQKKYQTRLPIIIVGTGPVGIRACQSLLKHDPEQPIVIFGDEPWEPYNRVKLSTFLSGETDWRELVSSQSLDLQDNVLQQYNCAIVQIDRDDKRVVDEYGNEYYYDKLILALGSRPHMPQIPGIELQRVYTFRDLSDAQHLLARRTASRSTVIVGGGLLGLEAARAMTRENTKVTVVDHSNRLMARQLDERAAEYLNERILHLGIRTYLGNGIAEIIGGDDGQGKVTGIRLLNGKTLECDTVIFAAGIVPNIELARDAGLSVGRGIRVNDAMQTSDEHIYAVGECVQHREKIYGIVAPGYEQAEVAIHSITGKKSSYTGSSNATQLKVVGVSLFSMGRVGEEENWLNLDTYVYQSAANSVYKKIVLLRNRLVGAIVVGDNKERHRLQEAIEARRRIWPWQLKRFLKHGELWPAEQSQNVAQWPASSIVCNCMNVSRGQCSKAISDGCTSIEAVMQETQASTVCGSCRPLIAELVGTKPRLEKLPALKSFLLISCVSVLLALLAYLAPDLDYPGSVVDTLAYDALWRDNTLKQISGFSILVLAVIGLMISLRKRINKFNLFKFTSWRYMHLVVGLLGMFVIFAHTGFRLGNNLNLWLMAPFVALVLIGGITGTFMSFQHTLDAARAQSIRKGLIWAHILLFWPIPALLAMHITKTYYF